MTNLRTNLSLASVLLAIAGSTLPAPASAAANARAYCVLKDVDATMLTSYPAAWPSLALIRDAWGTAVVQVDLSEDGSPRMVRIVRSTGNAPLDAAALAAVRSQKYAPKIHDCHPVAGSYLVEVEYPPSE